MEQTPDETALHIEQALDEMFVIKDRWELDEIRPQSLMVYNTIFDAYDEDESNGITTDKYEFLEQKPQEGETPNPDAEPVFILKLK